jgi:hypothetical protein
MTSGPAAETPPLSRFLRPQLPAAALHGLPGEVAVTLGDATGADRAAVLLAFLVMVGNAAGPQPHVRFGGAAHPARLFVLIVGDPSAGRKGTAVLAVERLFREADPGWSENRILRGLRSPQAMIDKVADGESTDCRLLVLEPEFKRLSAQIARAGDFSPLLRSAWDGDVLENNTRDPRRSKTASNAHVSVIGSITGAELMQEHRRLGEAGGLESRFLFCCSAPSKEVSGWDAATAETGGLAERLRLALETSRRNVLERADPISRVLLADRGLQPTAPLPVADEVRDGWPSLVKTHLPPTSDDLSSLWARAEPQIVRLSAGFALADCAPEVGVPHVQAAVATWQFCAHSAEVLFALPIGQAPGRVDPVRAGKVIRLLHDRYPRWVPQDDIGTGLFKGNVPAAEIELIMADLTVRDLVERREIKTGGRPRTEWALLRPRPG